MRFSEVPRNPSTDLRWPTECPRCKRPLLVYCHEWITGDLYRCLGCDGVVEVREVETESGSRGRTIQAIYF